MRAQKSRIRREIGLKLKALREARLISQAELSRRLGISQAGLSKIERGLSSLNTEDFLHVLQVFNVPASHFYSKAGQGAPEALVQNALTRLGAFHLYENASLPSETLEQAHQVIREVLVDGRNPRHITALAPVVVAQIDRIQLVKLWGDLINLGLERRLGWLLENILAALRLAPKPANPARARSFRQTEAVVGRFLDNIRVPETPLQDVLGVHAPSRKTISALEKQSSPISGKWKILSPFQIQDFLDALKASHDAA